MNKRIIRRKGYEPESQHFRTYTAQMNTVPQSWSGQPTTTDDLPEGLLRREYAWRKGDFMSEVVIPFCHALGYGAIGSGAGLFIARLGGLPQFETILLCGGVTFASAYMVSTKNMLRSMWTIEEFGTEEIEESKASPHIPPQEIKIELTEPRPGGGTRLRFLALHTNYDPERLITTDQLTQLATRCILNKENFSRNTLTRKPRILSQSEYPTLRDEMLRAGLLRNAGGNNEVELSPAGRALLTRYLEMVEE